MITFLLISIPLIFALLVVIFRNNYQLVKYSTIIAVFVELLLSVIAFVGFDTTSSSNYAISLPLSQQLGICFSFSMDGISLMLVLLTTIVSAITAFAGFSKNKDNSSIYALLLLMESALIGVFTVQDGLMFYVFWELTLIPAYFICALWGGKDKIAITLKFFIYTVFGSLFMLVAILYLYTKTPGVHQFSFSSLVSVDLTYKEQLFIFAAFMLSFAIKIPLFPFHSWQPDTYTVAPAEGSMLLAGVMMKMGLYGIIRFILPLSKEIMPLLSNGLIIVAVISLIYGSIIAIRQTEIKRLIAYSSLAHAGLMIAALFTLSDNGIKGSLFQMFSHGINIVGLFFMAEIIRQRTNTTNIADLSGIVHKAPRFAVAFMIVLLGSIALPLTNGFVGEFLMFIGVAGKSIVLAAIAGLSIIFCAVYMLWLFQKVIFGDLSDAVSSFKDLTTGEMVIAVVLILLVILPGIYPQVLINVLQPAVDALVNL